MASIDGPLTETITFVRDACNALGWSQRELSRRSGVPQTAVSRLFRGRLDAIDLAQLARIAHALGGRIQISIWTPFLADRARQRDRVHASCIGYVATRLRRAGWTVVTEVEIDGRFGPGWIDILAWDPGSGALLVIEIKTEVHDLGQIQRTLGWYERMAWVAARRMGWVPRRTSAALLLLATEAVDDRLRDNRELIRVAFPRPAQFLRALVNEPESAKETGWSIALIDPLSRAGSWLRVAPVDGRSAPSPHRDYAAVARRLSERSCHGRQGT